MTQLSVWVNTTDSSIPHKSVKLIKQLFIGQKKIFNTMTYLLVFPKGKTNSHINLNKYYLKEGQTILSTERLSCVECTLSTPFPGSLSPRRDGQDRTLGTRLHKRDGRYHDPKVFHRCFQLISLNQNLLPSVVTGGCSENQI